MGSINMLERTRRFDDSIFEGPEEDTDTYNFNDHRPAPYQFARSIANVHSDDSMPLFLSNRLDEPEQPEFENPWEGDQTWARERKRPTASSRVLKMGALAVVAAAIIAGLFSLDATHAVIVNAKASFAGLPTTLLSTSQPDGASRSAAPVQANIGPRPVSIAATPPTREEIAAALKSARQESARQTQPEIRAPEPVAAPPAAPAARRMDPDELAALLKRARGLVATGDITSARLLLERAAEAQEASAALLLAQTYDPAVLGTQDLRSITPDPAMARDWYQKAAQFGSQDAQQRLAQMRN
jgi:hypothetical protein